MYPLTGGGPKTLLPIGPVTALDRIVRVGLDLELSILVGADCSYREIAEHLRGRYGKRVSVVHREPQGYLYDVSWLSAGIEGPILVVDADTVCDTARLSALAASPVTGTGLVFGVAATPLSDDVRSIRLRRGTGHLVLVPAALTLVPRCAGAYSFAPDGLAWLWQYASTPHRDFHGFVDYLCATRAPCELFDLGVAVNMNEPNDHRLAQEMFGGD